ncbi:MAG: hypothetical protein JNM07_02420 [Phycisphaerae bacterium]|nr:hypothetical protein [Phycisphaerae bacterium]
MRARSIGLVLLIVGIVAFGASLAAMVGRVREFHQQSPPPRFFCKPIIQRTFEFRGRPVSVIDEPTVSAEAGMAAVRFRYGAESRPVPVVAPPAANLPDLGIYSEWLKVLAVRDQPGPGRPDGEERLVLVVRRPPQGLNPLTWGSVKRRLWEFDFYEARPDGTIDQRTFRFPRSFLGERSLRQRAEANESGSSPDAEAAEQFAISPLEERTWEYAAALNVIPALQVPNHRFNNDAIDAMGWTLPVAGFAGLGAVWGAAMVFAGRGRTRLHPAAA